MDTTARPAELDLRFCIEDDAVGTLEGVLAIVRRTGAELRRLRAGAGSHGLEVWMRLHAPDHDLLHLCRLRLENVAGIADVLEPGSGLAAAA
jgi:hypothetical protein